MQFSIDSLSGDVSLVKPLDYEQVRSYRLVIRAQGNVNTGIYSYSFITTALNKVPRLQIKSIDWQIPQKKCKAIDSIFYLGTISWIFFPKWIVSCKCVVSD